MSWSVAGAIAAGGALGALGRHLVNVLASRTLATMPLGQLPVATFGVNLLGSFLMGVLVGGLLARLSLGDGARGFLTTGLLGGFTTFSAFSLELGAMVEQKQYGLALGYGSISVGAGLGAFLLGLALMRGLS